MLQHPRPPWYERWHAQGMRQYGEPGEAARSIRPTASTGARPNPLAMRKQKSGNRINWQTRPIRTGLGNFTTRIKSAGVSDNPSPSMMMPRAMGRNVVSKGVAIIIVVLAARQARRLTGIQRAWWYGRTNRSLSLGRCVTGCNLCADWLAEESSDGGARTKLSLPARLLALPVR